MNSPHRPEFTQVPSAIALNPARTPWWTREVISLLGLPFDAVSMDQTLAAIRLAVQHRHRLFLSTANVNFTMAARKDARFRESVLCSDLVVVDGMPLVWLARLQGLPIKERVAGANIFERLLLDDGPPMRVYFFGGPPGAAQAASEHVNGYGGALHCVGWSSPGFVSVEELSTPQYLEPINQSQADFVVVSLGAAKGQAWIMRNRDQLDAPVLSHLGAVVNFMAGTVERAPRWMQLIGLEWTWRIAKEPSLWRRYWNDGVALTSALIESNSAAMASRWKARRRTSGTERPAQLTRVDQAWKLTLARRSGPVNHLSDLRQAIACATADACALTINLHESNELGAPELAVLQLAQTRLARLTVHTRGVAHRRQLNLLGIDSQDESSMCMSPNA